MAKAKQEKVSVLSFEKKLVPSAARMYGTTWDNKKNADPLAITDMSNRGTISNRLKPALKKDPEKLDAEVGKANLQVVDVCSLGTDHDTLKLSFSLKVLGGVEFPSSCNNAAFNQTYQAAVKDYIKREGFKELANRYATNLANGRFLWRNRPGAEEIEIHVKAVNKNKTWVFDAHRCSIKNFVVDDANIADLAKLIAEALSSENDFLMLEIDCYAKVGKAQDVYPSQELILDKGQGKKSKVLYSVDGIAAMHSQKIGNALRSIDTWYPEHSNPETGVGPIAIEVYGSVTTLGRAFRSPKDNQDFYSLFDRFARGEKLNRIEDEHFVMAVLVRGGIFGEID